MIDEPCMLGSSELVQLILQNIICSSRAYPNDLNFYTIQNPADIHVRIYFPVRFLFLLSARNIPHSFSRSYSWQVPNGLENKNNWKSKQQ